MRSLIKIRRSAAFSLEIERLEKIKSGLQSLYSGRSTFYQTRREWNRYSSIIQLNKMVEEKDGQLEISPASAKRVDCLVKAIGDFTADQAIVFCSELKFAISAKAGFDSKEAEEAYKVAMTGLLISSFAPRVRKHRVGLFYEKYQIPP